MHFQVVAFTELPKLLEVLVSELIQLFIFYKKKDSICRTQYHQV